MIDTTEELVVGNVYYMVTYADSDRPLPIIRCLVYLGKDIEESDEPSRWYFQDSQSFAAVGPYPTNDNDPDVDIEIHHVGTDGLQMIFDLRGMYDDLARNMTSRS